MRSRNIKPGFFKNDTLAELDFAGRLLFIGLWGIADRAGRLEDRPKKIKAEVFPYDEVNVDAFLGELARLGFILRYEADGERYIQIVHFNKHQNPHPREAASTIPEPGPVPAGSCQGNAQDMPSRADSPFLTTDSPSQGLLTTTTETTTLAETTTTPEYNPKQEKDEVEREQAQAVWLIIGQHGLTVLNDAAVFRGLLYDYCPEARNRETELLVRSVGLGVASRLVLAPESRVEQHDYLALLQLLQQQAAASRQEAEAMLGFWLNYAGKTVAAPVAANVAVTGGPTAPAATAVKQAKGSWQQKLLLFFALGATVATASYLQLPEWLVKPMTVAAALYIMNKSN